MTENTGSRIPDELKAAARKHGIDLRLELATTEAKREAATLWGTPGVIEIVNAAFERALLAEREATKERIAAQADKWVEGLDMFSDKAPRHILEKFAAAIRGS